MAVMLQSFIIYKTNCNKQWIMNENVIHEIKNTTITNGKKWVKKIK